MQKNYVIMKKLDGTEHFFMATKLYVWTFYYYAFEEYLIMK